MSATRIVKSPHGNIVLSKARVDSARYRVVLDEFEFRSDVGWVTRVTTKTGPVTWERSLWFQQNIPISAKDTVSLFGSLREKTMTEAAISLVDGWSKLISGELFADPEFLVVPYPSEHEYTRYHLYRDGQVHLRDATFSEMREFIWANDLCPVGWDGEAPKAALREMGFLVEDVFHQEDLARAQKEYLGSHERRDRIFKEVLFYKHGITGTGHPWETAFEIAWRYTEEAPARYGQAQKLFSDLVGLLEGETDANPKTKLGT